MVWTHLGAKLAREQMSEAAMLEFDPATIGRLAVDDIMGAEMQTSLPHVRNTEPASGSQPAPPEPKKKKKKASSPKKKKKAVPEVQAPVQDAVDVPSADEISLIPPNGVPVDVVSTGEHKRFVFIEVNMALKLWVAENAIRDVSFVKGHQTLKDQIDRNGIEQAYSNICETLKIAAQQHPDPIRYYEHMLSIFYSYVNPEGDPDVHPVVTGLDADDFSVDKLLGPQELQAPPARRDIDGADFEDDLSKRGCIRLQSDIIAKRDARPPVTRSARTHLDYEALATPSYVPPPADIEEVISIEEDPSAGAPAEKDAIMDLVLHTGDTHTDAPTGCIADVVNLVEDDGMKSPPPSQMIPVLRTELVDLSEYTDSPEENRRLRRGWPTRESLTKADIQSGCLPKQYMRGDVINCYINERFLAKLRDQQHNMSM
ncbi:hypothetical protein R1sor_006817 [Riccia sorocarpa]|uniref:Uncharacterized protein n=1 Tax=Riccia sorocarpa TaxID=122646 RepID=A0ABD3HQF3_9MARC